MSNDTLIKTLYDRNKSRGLYEKVVAYNAQANRLGVFYPRGMNGFEEYADIFGVIVKLSDGQSFLSVEDAEVLRKYNVIASPFQIENLGMNSDENFIVVSDFHSVRYPFEKVKQYYMNEYDKVYILGDATDRGNDKEGSGGIQLLLDIMETCKKSNGKVQYIPGNHDEFIIGYIRSKFGMDTYYPLDYHYNLLYNGGIQTIKDLETLKKYNFPKFKELFDWLGNLPLQRTHYYDGVEYVLGHAKFNQKLYDINPNYSLNDMFKESEVSELRRMANEVLWFRKNRNSYRKDEMPSSNKRMVIGHSKQSTTDNKHLSLIGSDGGKVEVFCVDGGIAYDGEMYKYDGGCQVNQTMFSGHTNTSKNSKDGRYETSIDKNREAIYQDFILGKILTEGSNGYNSLIKGEFPKKLGKDGRNRVINLFYDGLFDYDEVTKRYLYINTFLFDYIIECQIERMQDRSKANIDVARDEASWLLDMYLSGTSCIDGSKKDSLKGDMNCFTSYRDARYMASFLGEKGIKEVLAVHGAKNVEEYIKNRFGKSPNGKKYIKK